MGPRLCSRGGSYENKIRPRPARLQWGRGFVAAEATPSGTLNSNFLALQWGRGFVAAEA